jgi:hypothetical protein
VLSAREERIWHEIVGSQPGRRRPCPWRDLSAVVIGGGWGGVLLLLFGVPMAALAVGAATGLIWLVWRFLPQVAGLPEQEDAALGHRSGTTSTLRR